jgi:hypothetical protein
MCLRGLLTFLGDMPKNTTTRKRATASRGDVSSVTCSALLVVNQAPFLKKVLSTCKRLRTELHQKQALLNDFEEQDRSAFQQWLNRTHGRALSQIRELGAEVEAYQFILHHLSRCAYSNSVDVPALYRELLLRKVQGTLFSYVPAECKYGFDSDGAASEDDEEEEGWEDDDEDPMWDFFDRAFRGRAARESDTSGDRAVSAKKAASDIRLKSCYRALAKRLHPDHSTLEESVRDKRWHEIQVAYQNSDLEALLRVEAICDMDDTGLTIKLGLARLRDLAAYHQSHLIPLRQALRVAKRDIAFGFASHGPSAEVRREVASGLEYQYCEVKDVIASLAQTAAGIRDEAEAQLRENEIATARAARRAEKVLAKRGKKGSDGGQMSFF